MQDHNPQFPHRQTNSQLLIGSNLSLCFYEKIAFIYTVGLNNSIHKKDRFLGQDQQEIAHQQPNKYFRRQILVSLDKVFKMILTVIVLF